MGSAATSPGGVTIKSLDSLCDVLKLPSATRADKQAIADAVRSEFSASAAFPNTGRERAIFDAAAKAQALAAGEAAASTASMPSGDVAFPRLQQALTELHDACARPTP